MDSHSHRLCCRIGDIDPAGVNLRHCLPNKG